MEWEDSYRASKRKNCTHDLDSHVDSEEESIRKPKMRLKNRRILTDTGQEDSIQEKSSKIDEPNNTQRSASETEEERSRKIGRPKRKKRDIDPEEAERKILTSSGKAPGTHPRKLITKYDGIGYRGTDS